MTGHDGQLLIVGGQFEELRDAGTLDAQRRSIDVLTSADARARLLVVVRAEWLDQLLQVGFARVPTETVGPMDRVECERRPSSLLQPRKSGSQRPLARESTSRTLST